MTAVALIGADGAGKTTVAHMLVERAPVPVRYVYMGVNAGSSNVSLPTTRLVHRWKIRRVGRERRARGESTTAPVSLHGLEHRKDSRGRVWAAARLANRIAEELLRQVVSSWHQARGFVVVYDRHFLFDYGAGKTPRRLSDRVHRWFLERVYPKPDLVIFLDAPTDVLLSRKQEVPVEYLEARRRAYLRQGGRVRRFEVVDAAQPLDIVYEQVARSIEAEVARSSETQRESPDVSEPGHGSGQR